jgi:hypothetical protein
MKEKMKDVEIELKPFKGITFIISGLDVINTELDDNIVQTQTMMGSPFMRGRLKTDTKHWDNKL